MNLRDKTRRRLFLLSGTVLGMGLVAGTGAAVRLSYIRKAAQTGRTEGLAAMARSDYPTALKQLGRYLGRYPNDADVLLPYAKARELTEESNHSNLGQAISLYQRVLELQPGCPEAQRRLLDLYTEVGFNTEAITLADKIVNQADPKSPTFTDDCVHALRCETVAQVRMQRLDAAQSSVQRLTLLSPNNLEIRILELQIRLKKGKPQDVMDYASKLAADHPNDSRFELLKSIAASLTGNNKTAAVIAKTLAAQPQVDATYTRLLVAQLDRVQLFDLSFACLQNAVKTSDDPEIRRLWIRRLFETNQFSSLIDQTASLDPAASNADIEGLAMRVLALSRSQRRKDATDLIEALENRGRTDPPAGKWAAALRAVVLHDSSNPTMSISALHDALLVSPNNPILLEELADAYIEAGLLDKAAGTWRVVTRVAPEWSAPLVHISQSLVSAGRAAEAVDAAKAAQLRAPHDRDALAIVAVASAASLPQGPSSDTDNVLALIENINRLFPKEADLLPLKVKVLAQAQRSDAAIEALRAALAFTPTPTQRTLLSLARVSQSYGLNMEEACWDASEKTYGMTPELALVRASWLRDHQRGADALALLENNRSKHAPDDIPWKTVWAQYLDQSDDPRAKAEWIALGDANPKDVQLQWRAVSARAVQGDHEFVGRTIDRLVALIGDDSMSLHMLRARWYLHGTAGDTDASQAAVLLGEVSRNAPDMLAPRLLLASCYMRLGNVAGAIDQMVSASDSQPDLAALSIEVARLLHSHGEFSRSRQYIDRACRSRQATLPVIREAASLLALQGDSATALSLLEKAYKDEKQLPADLVLASLYRQANQPNKTSEICKRLMEKPDAPSVAFTADFYASQGQLDKAKSTLELLDGLKFSPGEKETILARYNARYGSSDDAVNYFFSAARAAPTNPTVWQQLVSFCFASGHIEQAIAGAREGGLKLPTATGFAVITKNDALIKDSQNLNGVRPLLMALGTDAAVNTPVIEAISDVLAASRHTEPIEQSVGKLRQLADRNPHILPLQTVTLEFYMTCGEFDEAARLAARTAQAFPTAVEPLRLENVVMNAERHFDEALRAAQAWKQHDSGDPLDADVAIATAELQLGDLSSANQQIQPYLDRAAQDPDKFSGIMLIRAVGLLANHKPDDVENLLGPLLAKSERIRNVWLSLAARDVNDPARAQAWLDRVSPLVSNSPSEQSDLALAQIAIGNRWAKPDDVKNGTARLKAVIDPADAPVKSLLSWAMLCEVTGNPNGAKIAYARILDPKNIGPSESSNLKERAFASNNLASLLVTTGGDLNQAQTLAINALAIYPRLPNFLDTLASVQAARKDYTAAATTMKQAKLLEPKNFKWRVNLLAILTDGDQTRAAKTELNQTSLDLPTLVNKTPELLKRYDQLTAKLQ